MNDASSATLRPLAGLRVVELAGNVAAAYCARLLLDLGAGVLRLEPPAGDPLRHLGPFAGAGATANDAAATSGGLSLYLNRGKGRQTIDLAHEAGRAQLERLIEGEAGAGADVLIEAWGEAEHAAGGRWLDRLGERHVRLVSGCVTPFGRSGRRHAWRGEEIVDWAMGGYMYFGGDPERSPLLAPGQQAEFHGGMQLAIAVLAALQQRDRDGRGQAIEVSNQEAVLSAHSWLSVMWSHEGLVQGREASDLVRCADGWMHFMSPAIYDDIFLLIERPDLLEQRPPLTSPAERIAFSSVLLPHLQAWAAQHTKNEIYDLCQELRIAVAPVNTVSDLLANPQLQARDYFEAVASPRGAFAVPGRPYRLSDPPHDTAATQRAEPRPEPDADKRATEQLRAPLRQASASAAEQERRLRGRGTPAMSAALPLTGVRVVEITANWAGPIAARHLADLGAEVIKVEWPRRPATRGAHYAGGQLWTHPYNRAGYFNKLNRNKLALTLDLSLPEGHDLLLRLVRASDVLVENNSARVMGNLGLAYPLLARENPRLIMLSISGYGATGPHRDHVAYGSNIEAACGLASLMGYSAGEPRRIGSFYADPIAGGHGAIAVLAALRRREREGRGMQIDVSLNESAICFLGDAFAEYGLTGVVPAPRGNRAREFAPQGCYACAGSDCWLALTVPDDATWQALCRQIERDDWLARADLARVEGRRAAHDEIDAGIAAWAVAHDHQEAARELQAAGIPAAPVLMNWELLSDGHLFDRGFYVPVDHPEAGVFPYPGLPWRLERTPASMRSAAPRFAEHNEDVLHGILGLSAAEIEALRGQGVIADAPLAPATIGRPSRAAR